MLEIVGDTVVVVFILVWFVAVVLAACCTPR